MLGVRLRCTSNFKNQENEGKVLSTRVVIVRHGESNFNILSKIQGRGNYDRP